MKRVYLLTPMNWIQYTVSHAFCVASASIGYLIWADVGNALTNHKPYFWMDPESVGSRETVMLYSSAFVALSGAGESYSHEHCSGSGTSSGSQADRLVIVFGFFYGLVGLRVKIETATREAHMKKRQVEVHQTQV